MSRYYSKDHEWIEVEGNIATIGITHYAQEQLGDIVFVDLPEKGKSFGAGDEACVVESVKAASEVYTAVEGEVVEVNKELENAPHLVNKEAETTAWFFKLEMSNQDVLGALMDKDAYDDYVKGTILEKHIEKEKS